MRETPQVVSQSPESNQLFWDEITPNQLIQMMFYPEQFPGSAPFVRNQQAQLSPSVDQILSGRDDYELLQGALLGPLEGMSEKQMGKVYSPGTKFSLPGMALTEGGHFDIPQMLTNQKNFLSYMGSPQAPWAGDYAEKIAEIDAMREALMQQGKAQEAGQLGEQQKALYAQQKAAREPYNQAISAWMGRSDEPFTIDDLRRLSQAYGSYEKSVGEQQLLEGALRSQ